MKRTVTCLGFLWRDKPGVTAWFERLKARPSFATAIAGWQSLEETVQTTQIACSGFG